MPDVMDKPDTTRCSRCGCIAGNHAAGDMGEPLGCKVCSCPLFTDRKDDE